MVAQHLNVQRANMYHELKSCSMSTSWLMCVWARAHTHNTRNFSRCSFFVSLRIIYGFITGFKIQSGNASAHQSKKDKTNKDFGYHLLFLEFVSECLAVFFFWVGLFVLRKLDFWWSKSVRSCNFCFGKIQQFDRSNFLGCL